MSPDEHNLPRVLFLWEMSAGHRANFQRMKPLLEASDDIDATVVPVSYVDDEGWLERRGLGSIAARVRPAMTFRKWLKADDWDAVWTNSRGARGNVSVLAKFPVVFNSDGTFLQLSTMPEYEVNPLVPHAVREAGQRRLARAVDRLEAWSDWARRSWLDVGIDPGASSINPPGIDLDLWHPSEANEPSLDDDRLRVVFVGGDFERKGGNDLLEWFRSQQDERIELHLVTPASVELQPGEFVHRLSPSDPELQQIVRQAHVSVLPSHAECFGIASIEALASGTPVVQTKVGGAADIVVDGVTGALIEPRQPTQIGAAIETIFADPVKYTAMRAAAREDAEKRFDLSQSTQRTVDLIIDLIEES